MIQFFVPGAPVTKGSWRPIRTRTGRVFLAHDKPREYESWVGTIRQYAQAHGVKILDGPVACMLIFLLSRPQAHYGKSKGVKVVKTTAPPYPAKKPDADKLARLVLDALTGMAWTDDAQVIQLHVQKRYHPMDAGPGCIISILAMEAPAPGSYEPEIDDYVYKVKEEK